MLGTDVRGWNPLIVVSALSWPLPPYSTFKLKDISYIHRYQICFIICKLFLLTVLGGYWEEGAPPDGV